MFSSTATEHTKNSIVALQTRCCVFITPITEIFSSNTVVTYTCSPCLTTKTQTLKDAVRRGCKSCNCSVLLVAPSNPSILETALKSMNGLLLNEEWKAVIGGWVSNCGRAVSALGKPLTLDDKSRVHLAGKAQYMQILVKEHFGLDKPVAATSIKVDATLVLERKRKTSDDESYENKLIRVPSVERADIPNLVIFQDGSVFHKKINKFSSFVESNEGPGKTGYLGITANNIAYRLHRLICMVFHPVEGRTSMDDYQGLEVNHKDGDNHNNHADNLEWCTHSENMNHAYKTGLNKKVRAILQFNVNADGSKGEFIKEHISIAQASKDTEIAEHEIRAVAKKTTPVPKQFFWEYKNTEETQAWSEKYALKLTVDEKAKKPEKSILVYKKNPDKSKGELVGTFTTYLDAAKFAKCAVETMSRMCRIKDNTIGVRLKYVVEQI
jgi:hypothetical protein